ncbi:hypothetical protein ES703_69282 [subsurface metagenome]
MGGVANDKWHVKQTKVRRVNDQHVIKNEGIFLVVQFYRVLIVKTCFLYSRHFLEDSLLDAVIYVEALIGVIDELVYAVDILKIAVVTELIIQVLPDEDDDCDGASQAEYIDEGEGLMT